MDLKETLYFRVSILEDNQVISQKAAAYTRQMIDMVLEQKPDILQDRAEMFFTHLAMAAKRTEEGTEENPMDAAIFEAVQSEPVFEEAVRLRDAMLSKADIEFTETEKDFLSVHLCNLLNI